MPSDQKRARDRRIQRTEALLRGALGALIREKRYEDIGVKEILHRANVGRSTFYTHFADKDELLLSCIHDILRPGQPQADILWFGLPIFAHIESHRRGERPPLSLEGRRGAHEHLERAIAELIEKEVKTTLRQSSRAPLRQSSDLLVRWIVSTFVVVLNWWLESDNPLPAREADALFRALVEPSLAEAFR